MFAEIIATQHGPRATSLPFQSPRCYPASLYRIIDLWYCILHHWWKITVRLALILVVMFLLYSLADDHFVNGFMTGQVFFTIFHIGVFWIIRLQSAYMRRFL